MERKVGETFKYKDVLLMVVNSISERCDYKCIGCYFDTSSNRCKRNAITGLCSDRFRKDGNSIIFKKVE